MTDSDFESEHATALMAASVAQHAGSMLSLHRDEIVCGGVAYLRERSELRDAALVWAHSLLTAEAAADAMETHPETERLRSN